MILIDCREIDLIRSIGNTFPFQIKQLPVGDIVIDNFVLERKTISDLSSSILDGRFREQRDRLRQVRIADPQVKVGYIIEGQPSRTALNGGQINALTSLGMEFCIFISSCVETTVAICAKIARGQTSTFDPVGAEREQAIRQNKIKTRSPKTILEMALLNIPGIGAKTAATIVAQYDSIAQFVGADCACSVSARNQANIRKYFGAASFIDAAAE